FVDSAIRTKQRISSRQPVALDRRGKSIRASGEALKLEPAISTEQRRLTIAQRKRPADHGARSEIERDLLPASLTARREEDAHPLRDGAPVGENDSAAQPAIR